MDIGPERRTRVANLVRETHLEGVEGVRRVLHHLRRSDGRVDEWRIDACVEQAQE